MIKRVFIVFVFLSVSKFVVSQNLPYVKGVIDTLTSPVFYGRGYVNKGDSIASEFIQKQLKKDGIKYFGTNPIQLFNISVNTFPGNLELTINGGIKKPGIDYMVMPDAPTMTGSFKTLVLNENTLKDSARIKKFTNKDVSNLSLVIDTGFKATKNKKLQEAPLIVKIRDKGISWHFAGEQNERKSTEIIINRTALPKKTKKVSVSIEAKLINNYQTQNVIAYIPGKVIPDSFIVFSAHYDHLGMMGKEACFPGANDNASGTAMLLDLAAYYAKAENQPAYSIAFLFFAAEEAGLRGSEYYTQHPLFPKEKIKFLLNLDMVGTGSDGIKVVNGSIFKYEFEKLKALNEKGGYLKNVSARGESANSDHYHFYKKDVKCFFIYTLGNEYKEYHTVNDRSALLPLTKYSELFKLICDFVEDLSVN